MGSVLVLVILWGVAVCALQRKLLFPRWALGPVDAHAVVALQQHRGERWYVHSPQGPVEAWWLPGKDVTAHTPGPVVLFAHGNGELIDHWLYDLEGYRQQGVSVLLCEFRGYGRSAGSPSQKAIVNDFVAFYDRLIQRPDVDPKRVFFHGRSVGGGVVAQLAAQRTPRALILQSTFTSVRPLAGRYLVPPFLVLDPFDVTGVLKTYQGPVLVMHGARDRVIPVSHAEKNHTATQNGRLVIYPDMGHNDPPPHEVYWQEIARFLLEAGIVVLTR